MTDFGLWTAKRSGIAASLLSINGTVPLLDAVGLKQKRTVPLLPYILSGADMDKSPSTLAITILVASMRAILAIISLSSSTITLQVL